MISRSIPICILFYSFLPLFLSYHYFLFVESFTFDYFDQFSVTTPISKFIFFIHPTFYSKEYQFEVKLKSFCLKIHVHFLPKRKNVTKENESIVDNLMQLF